MRVVVTRPIQEANSWVDALQAAGHDAVALPLIDIRPSDNHLDIQQVWKNLPNFSAVMFVSSNAVSHFFCNRPPLTSGGQVAIPPIRAWATGPGTRAALVRQGWAERLIDCPSDDAMQFDSEALWDIVKHQVHAGDKVLFVRGESQKPLRQPGDAEQAIVHTGIAKRTGAAGRDWLAENVRNARATPFSCISYFRCSPIWTIAQKQTAQQSAGKLSTWLFSSSEAIDNLTDLMPSQNWLGASAVVTHPRISERAKKCGFGRVELTRPTIPDVLASIELWA